MKVRIKSGFSGEYYGYARREADEILHEGRVTLNGQVAASGDKAEDATTEWSLMAVPFR